MGRPTILLLPGLDGDGFYLAELLKLLQREHPCERIVYPHTPMNYEDLCAWVSDRLDVGRDYVIVAESFGGPLGILLAEVLDDQARGLVLSATFCEPPGPTFFLWLFALLYPRIIPFKWMARLINYLLCNGRNLAIAQQVHRVLLATPDMVITHRLRLLRTLNMRPASTALTLPCLVIEASQDRMVKGSSWRHLYNYRQVVIEGPHNLTGVEPEAVAKTIGAFIRTLPER